MVWRKSGFLKSESLQQLCTLIYSCSRVLGQHIQFVADEPVTSFQLLRDQCSHSHQTLFVCTTHNEKRMLFFLGQDNKSIYLQIQIRVTMLSETSKVWRQTNKKTSNTYVSLLKPTAGGDTPALKVQTNCQWLTAARRESCWGLMRNTPNQAGRQIHSSTITSCRLVLESHTTESK